MVKCYVCKSPRAINLQLLADGRVVNVCSDCFITEDQVRYIRYRLGLAV